MDKFGKIFVAFFLAFIQLALASKVNDEACENQLTGFDEAMEAKEFWAFKLKDSWGKINSGYLVGNFFSLGSYSECLNFAQPTNTSGVIEGQYCKVTFGQSQKTLDAEVKAGEPKMGFGAVQGVCLPATCSTEKVLEYLSSKLPDGIAALKALCETNEPFPLDNIDIAAIAMLSVAVFLVILSTIYDVIARQNPSKSPNKLLVAFSAYTNGESIFKVNRAESTRSVACLEGLRSISMLFVMLSHRINNQYYRPSTNILGYLDTFKHYKIVFFLWVPITVDTFLVLGGFLSASSLLNAFTRKNYNAFQSIVKRYLRYTPILVSTLLCALALFRHSNDNRLIKEREKCEKYWWSLLLHAQNYVNFKELCSISSWYLSVDFQLFLISPLLIYPALKHGWKYLWVLPVSVIASCLYTMQHSLEKEYRVKTNSVEFYADTCWFTHVRLPAWFIGMVLGYIVFKIRDREVVINKKFVSLIWTLVIGMMAVVIALFFPFYQYVDNQTTLMENALFLGFHRTVWSIGVAWIIFACYKLKSGGFIRWFLSWPEWQPIARLSLCMYLTHDFYQMITLSYIKEPITLGMWSTITSWISDIAVVLFVATFFCLTFEMPIVAITNLIFANKPQKKSIVSESPKLEGETEISTGIENPAFVMVKLD